MTCEAAREQAVLFATGALGAAECALFFDHLDRCSDCQTYLERIMAAVERLPYAARPVAPPPRLRDRVLAAVAAEAGAPARGGAAAGPQAGLGAPQMAPEHGQPLLHGRAAARRRPWGIRVAAVAAGVLLVLNAGLATSLAELRAGYRALAGDYAALEARYASLAAEYGTLEARYRELEQAHSQALTQLWGVSAALVQGSPDRAAEAELTGTGMAPGARGRAVVYRRSQGYLVVLVVDGLPPLEGDQVYQAWLLHDGQRANAGVFTVDENGHGSLAYYTEQFPYAGIGITREPDPWGETPRGQRMLGGIF